MNETNARIEPGCVEEVAVILEGLDAESVFLIADQHAYVASGVQAVLAPRLADFTVVEFDAFGPLPKYQDVTRGVELFRNHPCDVTLVVGGGAILDMGKLIGFCAAQPEAPVVVLTNQAPIRYRPKPLIAIPTTSGTGSEITPFAVAGVDGRAHFVAHEWLLPMYARVDPELTVSLSPEMTAHMGLCAFSQAMASMWSVYSTGTSMALAREVMGLVRDHLVKAVKAPTPGTRWAMSRAAHLSGQVMHVARFSVCDVLAYPLLLQFGVSHGLAVALTLGTMAVFNAGVTHGDVGDSRGVGFVQARVREICDVLLVRDVAMLCDWLDDLLVQLGCVTRLHEVAVTVQDIPTIARAVSDKRLASQPRRLTQDGLQALLVERL